MTKYYVIEHETKGFLCDVSADGAKFRWSIPANHRDTMKYMSISDVKEAIKKYKLRQDKVKWTLITDPRNIKP